MTRAALMTWLQGDDVPGLVRAILEDLGEPIETSARLFGFNPSSEWGSLVCDVAAGGTPVSPFSVGYVVRGLVALWLLRCGGWKQLEGGGGYRRSDGASVNGNGVSSWATVPGRRGALHDTTGAWGCEGPIIRHDVLRLMLRIEGGEVPG